MAREVIALPPKRKPQQKLKVAAYARVSCDKKTMLHSLSEQVSRYSKEIQSNPNWEYIGVYADKAYTGTSESRPEFQRLITDCRAGKIDLVLTKMLSRFARNTATTLEYVREFRSLGIDIFFETENIDTLDSSSEMLITIWASQAQEQSHAISKSIVWTKRKQNEDGIVHMATKNFLGYDKNGNGEIINELL